MGTRFLSTHQSSQLPPPLPTSYTLIEIDLLRALWQFQPCWKLNMNPARFWIRNQYTTLFILELSTRKHWFVQHCEWWCALCISIFWILYFGETLFGIKFEQCENAWRADDWILEKGNWPWKRHSHAELKGILHSLAGALLSFGNLSRHMIHFGLSSLCRNVLVGLQKQEAGKKRCQNGFVFLYGSNRESKSQEIFV